ALDPIARTVVREAAILGTPFDTRVLQAITSLPGGLHEALDRLTELRVLAPAEERAPFHRNFHQTVILLVAYPRLLNRRRRELHQRAAGELEALYAGRESDVLEDLAEHYARAEVRGPAVRYLSAAAARAQSLYANDRARALHGRLLELIPTAPDDE